VKMRGEEPGGWCAAGGKMLTVDRTVLLTTNPILSSAATASEIIFTVTGMSVGERFGLDRPGRTGANEVTMLCGKLKTREEQ
jgi:hypothetical protein